MRRFVRYVVIAAVGLLLGGGDVFAADNSIPLEGEWRFALDRTDAGVAEKWFTRDLTNKIELPGSLQAQGFGDEISTNSPWVLSLYDRNWFLRADYTNYAWPGAVKVPFLCQPPRHYIGVAWYQRDIEIPVNWTNRRVVLFLERVNWESRVWLDDQLAGTNNSLCAPHEFELGVNLKPGKHTLTVRVDNRMILPYRPDAHSVSDSLGQSWNGIVGNMEMRSTSLVWIEDVQLMPAIADMTARLRVRIGNRTGKAGHGFLSAHPAFNYETNRVNVILIPGWGAEWSTTGGVFECGVGFATNALTWDEFHPELQKWRVSLSGDSADDLREVSFGLREFKAVSTHFEINGRPTYLRGTHHGGDFPLTGYPPTDVEYWRKLFTTCKEWGLNHMRFHSFCPPDEAFQAADELGFYISIEAGMWNTFDPGSPMEAMLYAETERIIKAYGNHPSFILFSPSNEPKGHWRDVLPKWAEHFRAADPRRLYTTASGFTDPDCPGPLDKVDFTITGRIGPKRVRGETGWFGNDYTRALEGVHVPVITHELGQWCAYPDFDVIKKFTGYIQPGNYEIFRDSAAANGVLEMNKEFALASGAFQTECYKEEIEANLRTPGLAGFQLLDLHDYTGQGTALVGLLDPFWESKGYISKEGFRFFCNSVVPLARLKQRVFTAADKLEVPVMVANFGETPLTNVVVKWAISESIEPGEKPKPAVRSGSFAAQDIPLGRTDIGAISTDLAGVSAPRRYLLTVSFDWRLPGEPTNRFALNSWKFWVYPPVATNEFKPDDVLVTSSWDDATAKLAAGGKVLFHPRAADLDWTCPPVEGVPIFWNRLMNPQWGRMLGLSVDFRHPALAEFPTRNYCDWQWTQIIKGVRAVNLAKLPRSFETIVWVIDDWNRNWKLGLLFEARVGKGRLLVSAVDLERNNNIVAQQLRRSLLDYMAGDKFQPKGELTAGQFASLRFDTRVMRKLGATAEAEGEGASAAIDGDPNTSWVAGARGRGKNTPPAPARPHTLTVTFTNAVAMDGLVLMNRQNDRDHAGDVCEFEVQISDDGTNWTSAARGELLSTWSPQEVRFRQTVTARQLRFTSLSGFGKDPVSALAELAVIYAGPQLPENDDKEVRYQRVRSTSTDVDEGGDTPTPKPAGNK